MRYLAFAMMLGVCAGCTQNPFAPVEEEAPPAPAAMVPETPPEVRAPPPEARTVEEFDVTTTEERVEAAAAPAKPAAERSLGTTIANLGDVTRGGFWIETPLVDAPAKGRVVFPGTGLSAQVDLIPIDGEATAGSRLSLAAMRLIEAPLTALPEIEVFLSPDSA